MILGYELCVSGVEVLLWAMIWHLGAGEVPIHALIERLIIVNVLFMRSMNSSWAPGPRRAGLIGAWHLVAGVVVVDGGVDYDCVQHRIRSDSWER